MRILSVLLIVCAMTAAAAPSKKKSSPKQAAGVAAARKPVSQIPPGATKVDEYTYMHTDAAGKTWYYRQTPFGIMRSEQIKPDATSAAEIERSRVSPFAGREADMNKQAESVTATETADTVTFVRDTPFGKQTWTRRKS